MQVRLSVHAALFLIAPSALPAQDAQPSLGTHLPAIAPQSLTLLAGTPVLVVVNEDLSTVTTKVGDRFKVTVANDVIEQGTIVVPKGTIGYGDVTFSTRKGGFGKPGILGISLRHLDLNGNMVALDGRYREEGKDNDGAAGATMFAVGVFAGFVKGKTSIIPKGRMLKARTGEDIAFTKALPSLVEPSSSSDQATENGQLAIETPALTPN